MVVAQEDAQLSYFLAPQFFSEEALLPSNLAPLVPTPLHGDHVP